MFYHFYYYCKCCASVCFCRYINDIVWQLQQLESNADAESMAARVDRLNSLLVRFVCSEALPFSTVDSDAFR